MDNKRIIESLASDLKRVALGLQRGSFIMADRFAKEALKRKNEVKIDKVPPYIQKLLNQLKFILKEKNKKRKAENALMYSTLFQNYALK